MLPVCYVHLYAGAVLTSLLLFHVAFVSANQVSGRFTSMKLQYRKQAQPPESSFPFFSEPGWWKAAEAGNRLSGCVHIGPDWPGCSSANNKVHNIKAGGDERYHHWGKLAVVLNSVRLAAWWLHDKSSLRRTTADKKGELVAPVCPQQHKHWPWEEELHTLTCSGVVFYSSFSVVDTDQIREAARETFVSLSRKVNEMLEGFLSSQMIQQHEKGGPSERLHQFWPCCVQLDGCGLVAKGSRFFCCCILYFFSSAVIALLQHKFGSSACETLFLAC